MLLYKDGITVEMVNPVDVERYKRWGFVEVQPEPELKAEKQSASRKPKTGQSEPEQPATEPKEGA